MRCPYCGCQEDKVVDSRASREGATIRRRRERVPGVAVVLPVLMPEEVGAAIVSGIEHDRRLVLRPSIYHAILIMSTLFPALVEWMMRRTGWHEGRAVRPA